MLFIYTLLGSSALFMMVQDIRKQTIPLIGLLGFAFSSVSHYVWNPTQEGVWVAGMMIAIFMGSQGILYLLKRHPGVGWGDLILSPFCGLWLQFQELPLYLISTGVFALMMGLYWRYYWKMKTFPLVPPLLLGLGCTLLIRCFLTLNGL